MTCESCKGINWSEGNGSCPDCSEAPLEGEYDNCPECGDPIDYCQGHGEIADAISGGRE